MKKALSVFLTIAMIVTMIPLATAVAFAEEGGQDPNPANQGGDVIDPADQGGEDQGGEDQGGEAGDPADDGGAIVITAAEGEEVVINQDGNYVLTGTYENVVIDGAQANVTLRDVSIDTTGKKKSAVFVKNGANVKFILEGESTIKGDNTNQDGHESCGIEVGVGTNVIFEGEGTLNVYGGRYGAAIGSWGTRINIPAELRRQVGTVTINSGNINAHGGINGAGIGSGYHVHCNRIVINGGVVHAYGNGLASGIAPPLVP